MKIKFNQNVQECLYKIRCALERGEITPEESYIEAVKCERVKIVICRLPNYVRAVLNGAVKSGELGHWKKDGKKPEVYFHPSFDYLAKEARYQHERETKSAVSGVIL